MSWKIRHQGSPKHIELTLPQIVQGLQDGQWEGSDEVVAPGETRWTPIEKHPLLEEVCCEIEEAERESHKEPEDLEEQRIDMNPLIDVCLVLLVFFILATTLQVLEKVLDVPQSVTEGPGRLREVNEEEVEKVMIVVRAMREGDRDVIKIEQREDAVPEDDLERALGRFVRETRKTELMIDAKDVAWGTVVKIIDAAAGARIKKVHFKANPRSAAPPPGA
jgi:biopolymer transport protein ExbD